MNVGMLWLDQKAPNMAAMIANAATYYHKKYGQPPNLCFVHPSLLETAAHDDLTMNITLKPDKTILPGLLWIGVEDQSTAGDD